MIKQLKQLINITKSNISQGKSFENILKEFRSLGIPPPICVKVFEEALGIDYSSALRLVYNSEAYKEFGESHDFFLDVFTKDPE